LNRAALHFCRVVRLLFVGTMSSKFAKQYQVPPEFPEILKDFAREVLRNQPANINEFAAKYFDCLASGSRGCCPGWRRRRAGAGHGALH